MNRDVHPTSELALLIFMPLFIQGARKGGVKVKGKTEPRLYTPPLRELTEDTSLGFLCISYAEVELKEKLYPWQKWALIHALEITGDLQKEWRFRFRTILFMIARQNGKTKLSYIIASFFMNVLEAESIFGTSLSLDKAEEVWESVIAAQESNPALSKSIERVARTNGNKRLILKNGSTYKVGAPTRRAGRGDSNDLVLLDEIREQRDFEVMAAATASTVAKPNGVIICFSNAGDPDSIVLRQLRSTALERITGDKAADFGGDIDGDNLGLFEWSSPEGASTDDFEALSYANPALGYGRLTERALMASRQTLPENKFRSECMCQQVETILPAPFPDGAWEAGIDETSCIAPESEIYYGIDMSQDRTWVSIAVCGLREDGNAHIEVVARRSGIAWAEEWFRVRALRGKMNLAFQGRGAPVTGTAELLCTIAGVERYAIEGAELTSSWGRFWDGIAACGDPTRGGLKIYHLPQPVMDLPAKTMQLRNLGGGVELPDRVKSPDEISALYACFMAFAAATKLDTKQTKIYESAYAAGGSVAFV